MKQKQDLSLIATKTILQKAKPLGEESICFWHRKKKKLHSMLQFADQTYYEAKRQGSPICKYLTTNGIPCQVHIDKEFLFCIKNFTLHINPQEINYLKLQYLGIRGKSPCLTQNRSATNG